MTRYCTICCKSSPGLDHHCTWLNTCIGESNYAAFYCLVVSATVQTFAQAVVGVLVATLWFHDATTRLSPEWHEPVRALLWVHNALCLSLANSYFLLAGFHTYLLCIGSGTYDFILENGSDGLCARLLKCRCLQRAKKRSNLSHVVDADSQAKQAQRSSPVMSAGVEKAAAAAAKDKKEQEIAQWKVEWLQKYGDGDDGASAASDGRATSSSTRFVPVTLAGLATGAGAGTANVAAEASTESERGHHTCDSKANARRTSTYPAELIDSTGANAVAPGEERSQVSMSSRVNRSEDIFEEVELVEGVDDRPASSGLKTDL